MKQEATRLFIHAVKKRAGWLYEVRLGTPSGEILMPQAKDPLSEGCRVLSRRGVTGKVELWDSSSQYFRLRSSIEYQRMITVEETRKCGPRNRPSRQSPPKFQDVHINQTEGDPRDNGCTKIVKCLDRLGDKAKQVGKRLP